MHDLLPGAGRGLCSLETMMHYLPQLAFDPETQQRREYAKKALFLFKFLRTSITTLNSPSYPFEVDEETAKGIEDCLALTESFMKIAMGLQELPARKR